MADFKIRMFFMFLAAVLLIDLYLWQAIRNLLEEKSERSKRLVFFLFWLIPVITFCFMYVTIFKEGWIPNKSFRIYGSATLFVLYASKLFPFIFFLFDDVKRGGIWCFRQVFKRTSKANEELEQEEEMEEALDPEHHAITRSEFLTKAGLLAGAFPFVILSRGMIQGAYNYQVKRVDLILPDLPWAFDGLKVLQVSDIHCGSFTDKDEVNRGIQLMKEQKAHLAFFTGDLVNNRTNETDDWMDLLAEIKAPMGVYSIFGNHDYGDYVTDWESPEAKQQNLLDLVKVHKDLGWNLLRNEHVLLEKDGQRIGLIGVENWGDRGRFQKFGDIDKAVQGIPDVSTKLLLSHDPSHFDSIISKQHQDIDVTFSGHTHGFQFGFEFGKVRWSPSQYIYPHWAGMYEVGKQKLYVNRGFGFIGYPGRVGIMPEITVFTLYKQA